MTTAEHKRLAKYVRRVANALGLHDWTINVLADEPDMAEAGADVHCIYGRRIANIRFAADFALMEPDVQRHIVVHELLHIHFDRALQLCQSALPAVMGAPAYSVFDEALRDHMEHGVDAVADALACAFTLPEV